jgi:hypothetical protein
LLGNSRVSTTTTVLAMKSRITPTRRMMVATPVLRFVSTRILLRIQMNRVWSNIRIVQILARREKALVVAMIWFVKNKPNGGTNVSIRPHHVSNTTESALIGRKPITDPTLAAMGLSVPATTGGRRANQHRLGRGESCSRCCLIPPTVPKHIFIWTRERQLGRRDSYQIWLQQQKKEKKINRK